jgi:hypothetical protein
LHREANISSGDRRYSENEFALILRKAFELQDRQPGGAVTGPADGLSLHEIQAIAREIGLDAALIERAAAEVPATAESARARFFGGPQNYRLEYTARGELSREGLSRVVDTIRRSTGHQGKLEEALGSLEWQTVGELSQIHVTVNPHGGETSVQIVADRGAAGAVLFMVPIVVGAVGIGVTGAILEPTSVAGIAAVVAGPLAAAFLTARTIWATTTRGFRKKLRNLMDAASRSIDENVQAPKLHGEPPEAD